MLKIGDFSRISRVPVKTLRYYDEIGLLRPAGVDHYTRYRYYSEEQLPTLRRILALKDLGFSLERIAWLLKCNLATDQLSESLLRRWEEIHVEMAMLQEQLDLVESQLNRVRQPGGPAGGIDFLSKAAQQTGETAGEGVIMKEAKIVKLDAFKVVGMPYLGKNEHGEISQMWGEFMPRMHEIKHLAGGEKRTYGLCSPNKQGLVDYIAGLPVTELKDIPEGMVGKDVPAQTYVMFVANAISDIYATYDTITKEWLPNSGYQAGDGPDFELYPDTFDAEEDPHLYIYFPIK